MNQPIASSSGRFYCGYCDSQAKRIHHSKKIHFRTIMARTIDVSYSSGSQVWLNKRQAKKFVGYKHEGTFNLALKALGITPPFNLKDLKRLLGLKLFLAKSRGDTRATRQTYTWLEANADINQFLADYGIDLNQEFERRRNEFNNQRKDNNNRRRPA